MNKLMCRFVATTKKKIADPNLDTACPAGIPCKYNFNVFFYVLKYQDWVNLPTTEASVGLKYLSGIEHLARAK